MVAFATIGICTTKGKKFIWGRYFPPDDKGVRGWQGGINFLPGRWGLSVWLEWRVQHFPSEAKSVAACELPKARSLW